MWKSLLPGDKVLRGDVIRYQPGTPRLISARDCIYDVVKTDQHYFEMFPRSDEACNDDPARKIIKLMDVGYHIHLEIWSGTLPLPPDEKKEQPDKPANSIKPVPHAPSHP
jgi:hypothetical protein